MILSSAGEVTKKYLNTSLNTGVISAATLEVPTLPAQGVTNGERESDSLALDHIQARFLFYNDQAAVSTSAIDIIRVVCVQAKASNAVTISSATTPATGVFDLGSTGAIDVTSFINYNAVNKVFHVLMDKTISVNFLSANATSLHVFNLKPKVQRINFTPGTTTTTGGQIYWLFVSLNGVATMDAEQRLIYHDL
jgi:hypothetical protein